MRFALSEHLPRDLNPASWMLISFLFFGQAAASIALSILIRLSFGSIAFPIGILLAGGAAALIFLRLDREGELGPWKWWIPAGIYMLFIFLLSDQSFGGVITPIRGDYFHPLEYWFLGLFLSRIWYSVLWTKGVGDFALRVLAAGMIFAASDELHQYFVPGREMSILDFTLDTAGLTVACVMAVLAARVLPRYGITNGASPHRQPRAPGG